jgi:RimJ/RimL family protein N-acetyltransferase
MAPEISARLASWPASLEPSAAATRLTEARSAAISGLALPLIVERRSDGAVAGWIGATRMETDANRAVLTYWLGAQFHGKGIMREAAPVALAATFRHLGVQEVRAAVQMDNTASRAILRALGMRLLGLGHIWCASRGREEICEWWAVERPAETLAGTTTESAALPQHPQMPFILPAQVTIQ